MNKKRIILCVGFPICEYVGEDYAIIIMLRGKDVETSSSIKPKLPKKIEGNGKKYRLILEKV